MIKIGLDLAYRSCGITVITEDKLFYTSNDLSKEKNHCSLVINHMTNWVFSQIQPYLALPHLLVMEDIFKGKWDNMKNVARVQGAVMDRYVQSTGKCPELVSAITARNRVNLLPTSPKVAIQLWALATFKLDKKIDKLYVNKINETVSNYHLLRSSRRKLDRKKLKVIVKDLDKQTLEVAAITGVDNHMSDSMVLALGAGV